MPKSEVDSFLDDVSESGKKATDDVFNGKQEDPFKSTDGEDDGKEKGEEGNGEGGEDKNLPFHKDPKIQRYIKKQVDKALEGLEPSDKKRFEVATATDSKKIDEPNDLVAAFTTIIGNDTPEKQHALKMLSKSMAEIEEKAVTKAMSKLSEQAAAESEATKAAQKQLYEGLENIEENFDVDMLSDTPQAIKLRNEFIEFIRRVAPKDADGDVAVFPDLEETFKLFKDSKKPTGNPRPKELASRTMARSAEAAAGTQKSGQSWKDVEKVFSKLSG